MLISEYVADVLCGYKYKLFLQWCEIRIDKLVMHFIFKLLRISSMLQMLSSLKKIMSLSDDTRIYCGHEYTLVRCF